jgi:hypothetical protein
VRSSIHDSPSVSGSPENRTQHSPRISAGARPTSLQLPSAERPVGDLNPCRRLERASILTTSRTGRIDSWESGSGGARILVSWSSAKRYTVSATDPNCVNSRKKPAVLRHRALKKARAGPWPSASQDPLAHRKFVRRFSHRQTREPLPPFLFPPSLCEQHAVRLSARSVQPLPATEAATPSPATVATYQLRQPPRPKVRRQILHHFAPSPLRCATPPNYSRGGL